jgi:hypothetical protein
MCPAVGIYGRPLKRGHADDGIHRLKSSFMAAAAVRVGPGICTDDAGRAALVPRLDDVPARPTPITPLAARKIRRLTAGSAGGMRLHPFSSAQAQPIHTAASRPHQTASGSE